MDTKWEADWFAAGGLGAAHLAGAQQHAGDGQRCVRLGAEPLQADRIVSKCCQQRALLLVGSLWWSHHLQRARRPELWFPPPACRAVDGGGGQAGRHRHELAEERGVQLALLN